MRHLCSFIAVVSLAACGTPEDPIVEEEPVVISNPYIEVASCPALSHGVVDLDLDGTTRTLRVVLPAEPQGASVVFAWHWLGGTASQTLDWMEMETLADDGFIVIAPESGAAPFEWDFFNEDDNEDLTLFDTTLSCLWDQYDIDTDRVYATGMSAGGLFTTWLTMHRSEVLAATAPFSGGTLESTYTEPEVKLPVLVTWGGESDQHPAYDFHLANVAFLDLIREDGHFAPACIHDQGHIFPSQAADMASSFFQDHVRGEPSPWEQALPSSLPDFCALP